MSSVLALGVFCFTFLQPLTLSLILFFPALELQLRNASSRLRVVQKLAGGAHLLLPGSETTIAIRVYFTKDLENIQNDDGLVAFRNAFKYPICFFVLPPGWAQQTQLSNPHLFVTQAQLIMNNRDGTTGQQPVSMSTCCCYVTSRHHYRAQQVLLPSCLLQDGSARVFIVPHAASAIDILSSVVQTLTPARRDLKKKFHDSVKSKNFVGDNASQQAASNHVTAAFRNFATRFELPVGEDDVLMSRFGSISGVGTADLRPAPIYDSTKDTLTAFFGSLQQNGRQYDGTYPQANQQQSIDDVPMGIQDLYGMDAASVAPFQQQQQLSSEFETPLRDSLQQRAAPMDGDERISFAQFDEWHDPSQESVSATPALASQQFVPRQRGLSNDSMPVYNQGPPKEDAKRLLPQFNRPPMGNSIWPYSSYSTASGNGVGETTSRYFG